ncbi:MAG TPA: hypothetical protein VL977_08715 [Solirubrobacteraceae bacterium]|nr:hypothetical protein [Solirubrobacteraceae bacterium]
MNGDAPELWRMCELLGHDAGRVRAGETVCTYLEIPTPAAARRVLSRASAEQRQRRSATFFDAIAPRQHLSQGMHDRGEAHVFADTELCEIDRAGLDRHFPIHVKALSALELVVPAGETFDVSVRGERWGLDHLEELYVVANLGQLVLEDRASLVMRGNVFSLVCQRFARRGQPPGFDIGILPTPFPVDGRLGPFDGRSGARGHRGRPGRDGTAPARATLLGVLAPGASRPADATAGEDGGRGGDGERGRAGGMAKLAELTVRDVASPLVVLARGGRGGDGGDGGPGGDGGRGGSAAEPHRSLDGALVGARGAPGGDGGDGGTGGDGGKAGIASNVYVTVPPEQADRVRVRSIPGEPGSGGRGGRPGTAGADGSTPSAATGPAAAGRRGVAGRPGKLRAGPAMFVNDELADDGGGPRGGRVQRAGSSPGV